jgi:hypothetical protein
MKINLVIEIEDEDLIEALEESGLSSMEELKGQINNTAYLGLDCIDAMLGRLCHIGVGNSYVEKDEPVKEFDYNSHFPTSKDFPLTDIMMRANVLDLVWDEKLISFAKACWAECAIKHNIITKE